MPREPANLTSQITVNIVVHATKPYKRETEQPGHLTVDEAIELLHRWLPECDISFIREICSEDSPRVVRLDLVALPGNYCLRMRCKSRISRDAIPSTQHLSKIRRSVHPCDDYRSAGLCSMQHLRFLKLTTGYPPKSFCMN